MRAQKMYARRLRVDREVRLFTFAKCSEQHHDRCSQSIIVMRRVVAICLCECHQRV